MIREKPKTLRVAILHALDRGHQTGLSIATTSLLVESAIKEYLSDKLLASKELGNTEFFDKFMAIFFDGRDI